MNVTRKSKAAFLAITCLLVTTAAYATIASSGWVYWGWIAISGHGTPLVHLLAEVENDFPVQGEMFHEGAVDLGADEGTDNPQVPANWLAANVAGFMDGAYCGETGWWFNAVTDDKLWLELSDPCGNPPGVQFFSTSTSAAVWNGNEYIGGCCQNSPVLGH